MKFAENGAFLVLRRQSSSGLHRIAIVQSREDALRGWTASTRISPIFRVVDSEFLSPDSYKFSGEKNLIFLGPIHPQALPRIKSAERTQLWLSIGLYNVVLVPATKEDCKKVISWAKDTKVPFEHWAIKNGSRTSLDHWEPPKKPAEWRETIAGLSTASFANEIDEAIQEYCPLMASAIARSRALPSEITEELVTANSFVGRLLTELQKQHDSKASCYRALGELLIVNAALSRFSSQTFAGTTPVAETECHFWSHSLLGIGIASIALRNFRSFIHRTLGAARLPERFAALAKRTQNVPDLTATDPPDEDYLWQVTLDEDSGDLMPLLTCFSARDGYRSTEMTVSAPLAAVSSCNSMRWSLLTITHEICHVIVRAIQSDLYPDLDSEKELRDCLGLLNAHRRASSLFHEIRRYVIFSIIRMDDVAAGRQPGASPPIGIEDLRRLLQHWRQDVDETMVHACDFLYFYGKDVDRYIAGIWSSWGTIPNIGTRVRDYVMRTVCAVMATHLRRDENAEDIARKLVVGALTELQRKGLGGRYVDEALTYLNNSWNREILPRVRARRQLVKIVNSFLFSEQIATSLRGEVAISGGASDREGYTLRVGHLDSQTIRNPLRFVEIYTESSQPSSIHSAWMLYVLAFCISKNGGA